MTDELAGLPGMMRVACRTMDAASCIQTGWEEGVALSDVWAAVRAELLRLAQYEETAGRLAIEKAEQRQRAERAEAELAALKRWIAEAATGIAKRSLAPGCLVIEGFDDDPGDFHNEHVALLPVGGEG